MKTEDELRAAFEQHCIDHLVAQREAGKPLIDDNGAPATHESLFWKREDGTYGVHAFNAAWQGYRWGVGDASHYLLEAAVDAANKARVALSQIDTADHVHHGPTDETWVVAYVKGNRLSPCGWPECEAELSDCTLVKKATDAERDRLLRELAASTSGGTRVAYAKERLSAKPTTYYGVAPLKGTE